MRSPRKNAGFTLLEIVLSLAVTALLLAGASFFLFSLSNIWLKAETEPGLDQHYLGATRFLEYVLTQAKATSSSSGTSSPGSSANAEQTPQTGASASSSTGASSAKIANVTWGYPPNESTAGSPLMQFTLSEQQPLFVWDDGPLPDLTCWLLLEEDDGLYVVWKAAKQSKENASEIYRTLVSALVTKISYLYYNESNETWEEDELPPSETMTGGTIKGVNFTFDLGGEERVFKIYFREKPSSLPLIY